MNDEMVFFYVCQYCQAEGDSFSAAEEVSTKLGCHECGCDDLRVEMEIAV